MSTQQELYFKKKNTPGTKNLRGVNDKQTVNAIIIGNEVNFQIIIKLR